MIRIVSLDRQPLMRRGVEAALGEHPDLVHAGGASDPGALWPLLYRTDPDVVLLGVDEPGPALELCLRLKRRPLAPRVVLYANPEPALAVPATLARADALADKSKPTGDLLGAIRDAAAGRGRLPAVSPREQAVAAARLDACDHAIFAMTLAGTPPGEIAATLRLDGRELARRTDAIVARLARPAPSPRRGRSRREGRSPAFGRGPLPA
jgi:DNA-binding NarL/FixJ family response regulator